MEHYELLGELVNYELPDELVEHYELPDELVEHYELLGELVNYELPDKLVEHSELPDELMEHYEYITWYSEEFHVCTVDYFVTPQQTREYAP